LIKLQWSTLSHNQKFLATEWETFIEHIKNYLSHRWPFSIHQNLTSFAQRTNTGHCVTSMKILLVHVSHELKKNVRTYQQKTGKIHSILPIFAMISDSHTIKFTLALMTAIKIDQFRNEENVAIFWRTKQKCSECTANWL